MTLVVAAAVVRRGRVLAAQRARPAALAGGWEFPGGKVERGEGELAAVTRELDEELRLPVVVGARLGQATDGALRLVLYAVRTDAEPARGPDHAALRWLAADELEEVEWLPIDRGLLPLVRELLQRNPEA